MPCSVRDSLPPRVISRSLAGSSLTREDLRNESGSPASPACLGRRGKTVPVQLYRVISGHTRRGASSLLRTARATSFSRETHERLRSKTRAEPVNTGCFKKCFKILKNRINLFKGAIDLGLVSVF